MNSNVNTPPEQLNPRLPGGFSLPPFGIHQALALVIVCVSLWAVGLLWLGMQAASQWTGSWQQDIRFHVYLAPAKKGDLEPLAKDLKTLPDVSTVRVVPRDETRQWLHGWLGNTGVDEDELMGSLPYSVEVSPRPNAGEFLFRDMRDMARRHGANVNEKEMFLVRAHRWLGGIRKLAWFATAVLALAMAIIISNTLRMTLLARADEVQLMRLLGAREWFVRMPFLLEGTLLGGGAGLLSWILLWPLVFGASGWLSALEIDLHVFYLLLPLLFCGAVVGCLGAWIATARLAVPDVKGA